MGSPSQQMAAIAQRFARIVPDYLGSDDFVKTAEAAKQTFVRNRQLGKAPADFNQPLKSYSEKLSDLYVKQRKRYSDALSPETSANQQKSNTTATGKMLGSLQVKLIENGFSLVFTGSRPSGINGKGKSISNEKVATYFNERRPFAYFAKSEVAAIVRAIRQQLVALYKR